MFLQHVPRTFSYMHLLRVAFFTPRVRRFTEAYVLRFVLQRAIDNQSETYTDLRSAASSEWNLFYEEFSASSPGAVAHGVNPSRQPGNHDRDGFCFD